MTTPDAPGRFKAEGLGPMRLLPPDDFCTPCWRVLNLPICDSELMTEPDGSRHWHPDAWLWFAWAPGDPQRSMRTKPPSTFGVAVGNPYDAVLDVVGDTAVQMVGRAHVDEVDLLERVICTPILEGCCRWRVLSMLDDAKYGRDKRS